MPAALTAWRTYSAFLSRAATGRACRCSERPQPPAPGGRSARRAVKPRVNFLYPRIEYVPRTLFDRGITSAASRDIRLFVLLIGAVAG